MEQAGPDFHVVAAPAPGSEPVQWEAVYRETAVIVYRFIYARVGNRPDAEDLTTQVFIRALPRLRLPAAIEEIRSYLLATARTVLADHWRRHYDVQVTDLGDGLPATPPPPTASASEEEGIRRANVVLASLPDNYRHVLELRFLRGYSLRETADAMGVSLSNAKVLQHRALRRAAGQEMP
jgi:RNA polymerase sigma-70 factor (ECF subfamily)